jgi:hypothetical protein
MRRNPARRRNPHGNRKPDRNQCKGIEGDSGGPEFLRTKAGDLIQGTVVGGAGSNAIRGGAELTKGSNLVEEFPEGKTACKEITEMKTLWKVTGVPIEGKGIPAKTIVKECKEVGATATIEMSGAATEAGVNVQVTIGHTVLSAYEPMSQIEAVPQYKGQILLVK